MYPYAAESFIEKDLNLLWWAWHWMQVTQRSV